MKFDLSVIDWAAISSMITGMMTIVTALAVYVSIRAIKHSKTANKIAQNALNELVLQREIQKIKDDKAETRWRAEQRFNMEFLKSEGINADDIYHKNFPEIKNDIDDPS
jgi:enolase